MIFNDIQVERSGDVGLIRLNDPKTLNAVSAGMIDEIGQALDGFSGSVRAMVLTGAGRAFSSGADLSGGESDHDMGLPLETHVNPLMIRLSRLPYPWISAVRGAAAGVGCSLALAADMVVASETAFFLQAFARVGLAPDGGSSHLLARAVGRVRAMEMMLLAERVPASRALQWGLINRVVPDEALDAEALTLATRLASGPTRALAMARQLVWTALDRDWETVLAAERVMQGAAGRTSDAAEGFTAFVEKRTAEFKGR